MQKLIPLVRNGDMRKLLPIVSFVFTVAVSLSVSAAPREKAGMPSVRPLFVAADTTAEMRGGLAGTVPDRFVSNWRRGILPRHSLGMTRLEAASPWERPPHRV